jgi:hypothetical protein
MPANIPGIVEWLASKECGSCRIASASRSGRGKNKETQNAQNAR